MKKNERRYHLVIQQIKREIEGRRVWVPGMKIPSERDLAAEFRVSRNTIRRAILLLISEGFLFSEVGRGTFVNSKQYWGKPVTAKKGKLIGIIITDVKSDFGKQIVHSVEDYLQSRGYALIIGQDQSNVKKARRIARNLINLEVKGVIIDPILSKRYNEDNSALIGLFDTMNIPIVLIDRKVPSADKISIVTNNEEIAYRATIHLLSRNHKKILVIHNNSDIMRKRLAGIHRAYVERGIDFDSSNFIIMDQIESIEKDASFLDGFLRKHPSFSALFSLNEYLGKVSLRAFSKLKSRLPRDISFITFDHPEDSSFEEGEITYIQQPLIQMGKMAAEVLVGCIETGTYTVSNTVIKSRFIQGRSVGYYHH